VKTKECIEEEDEAKRVKAMKAKGRKPILMATVASPQHDPFPKAETRPEIVYGGGSN